MTPAFPCRLAIICCTCLSFNPLFTAGGFAQTFFTDVTGEMSVPMFGSRSYIWGDYDNDGWVDQFRAENYFFDLKTRIALLHNEGNGRFAEQSNRVQAPEMPSVARGNGALFGDYDNDGDLDLFVTNGAFFGQVYVRNALLRNDRGVFVDVTLEVGLTDELPTDNAIWLDYDRDGFVDLYTGNLACGVDDPSVINRLYRNNGDGTFADATEEAGLDVQIGGLVGGCAGGSNGGMVAGDFNDDGWPDLYIAVYNDRNRLFLNNGHGEFVDVTTEEIAHDGEAFGIAVGDVDNGGSLDIFMAAGGLENTERSALWLNLGEGQFLDVTEAVGLVAVTEGNTQATGLADLDNDGDLDLTTAGPPFIFVNQGDGTFTEETGRSGLPSEVDMPTVFGDFNGDGFIDGLIWDGLYRNNGNGNHWLRVELVGVESNRDGIGARLTATAGNLRQMREILGGTGLRQDEMVAHFGLGSLTQVDRLETRWPSGKVEVLENIPADQKIRIIEGKGDYHVVRPTVWEEVPDTLVAGDIDVRLAVRPALFEAEAEITRVTADFSAWGGVAEVPLLDKGDGVYALDAAGISLSSGIGSIAVMVDQQTPLGPYWTELSRQIAVLPAGDLQVFDEMLGEGWAVEGLEMVVEEENAHRGDRAGRFLGEKKSLGAWSLSFPSSVPVDPFGYLALRFAFRPGKLDLPSRPNFGVRPNDSQLVNLLERVDLAQREWQVVEIPMEELAPKASIEEFKFFGNFGGDFYLDDVRLVAGVVGPPANTAVAEGGMDGLPQEFVLDPNYPNPFNSETAIRFALPMDGEVELAVFNLMGQKMATLVEGWRGAGGHSLKWDGRGDGGEALASGVYCYRLWTEAGQVAARKLLLLK